MLDGHPSDDKKNFLVDFIDKIKGKEKEEFSEEELIDLVNEGHENGVLKENEAEMISNIIEFGDKQAHDVMTHRNNIVAIDDEKTVEETFQIIINENFSRYPIYSGDLNNVVGILHIRDLIKIYADQGLRNEKLKNLTDKVMFQAVFVPETRNVSQLFREMQSEKQHMAIVVDEYGQTSGIITMEDILEEIVGNIFDEYDEDECLIVKESNGSYIVDGMTELSEIEEFFNIEFNVNDIDTINGYILYRMGRIPQDTDDFECTYKNLKFKVLEVKNRMIKKIRLQYLA